MRHPTLRLRERTPKRSGRRALWLGLAGGFIAELVHKRLPRISGNDLKRRDYSTSTQRMGMRFTERIRDTFRFRWIRRIS